jgi:UDP-2,3-diacylglucosamine pyrophosphatase LpxH
VCKTAKILQVLDSVDFKTLIINGDLFDCHNLKRFRKSHWRVLSAIRKLTKSHRVVFVGGNHDGDIETVSLILGLEFVNEFKWKIADKKFMAIHGHVSDGWVSKHPILTEIFTGIYYIIQLIDKKQRICGFLKKKSKTILRVDKSMRDNAFEIAKEHKVDGIFLGHSHISDYAEEDGIVYANSGSFCELPCHFITIDDTGKVTVNEI